jgi:hypothetical protein
VTTVLVRFAPVFTVERFNDPAWNREGRRLYYREALTLLPGCSSTPLLIDHDPERVIGTVHALSVIDSEGGPWVVARATVNDPAPSWLKKGTAASHGWATAHRADLGPEAHAEILGRGIVREVSVLSPGVKPYEPDARVLIMREAGPPAAVPDRSTAGVIHGGGLIQRPALGRVLAVTANGQRVEFER